jgi:hypothetical protein
MPQSYTKRKGNRLVPDPNKFLFNIDTFWFNVDLLNYDEVMESGLLEKLIEGRNFYLDSDSAKTIEVFLSKYENPIVFEIMGGQPPLYQYSIRNDDIAIYFSKKKRDDGTFPVKVQLNQFILWDKGLIDAYIEALNVLIAFGFAIGQAKLNRIDFAVHSDQFQWNLTDLKTFEYPRNIANDNKPNIYKLDPITLDFETANFGDRSRLQLRIYNKSKEILKNHKFHFIELYKKHGMNPEKVWNIEIEVRRDYIKECKDLQGESLFDDLDKVFEEGRISVLWSYLMTKFNHPSAFWTVLAKGQKGKFESVNGFQLDRRKDIDFTFEREVAQIAGRLMKGVINSENYSLDEAIKIFKKKYIEIEVEQKKKSWKEQVEKKKLKIMNWQINSTVENEKKLEEKRKRIKEKIKKMNIQKG